MTKVHWLAAGVYLRVSGVLFASVLAVGTLYANSPANGKQGRVPEEITQTLLSNKKQGKNCRSQEFVYFNRKSEDPLENLETGRQLLFRPKSIPVQVVYHCTNCTCQQKLSQPGDSAQLNKILQFSTPIFDSRLAQQRKLMPFETLNPVLQDLQRS
jgi:hypothetical protein